MTVVCPGGGTSSVRPTSPAVVFLAGEVAAALAVETLGLSAAWVALLGYAAGQTIDLSSFCGSDPPAIPTFTASDVFAILSNNVIGNPSAYGKLLTLEQVAAWYAFCQCDSVATPAPPTPPSYPSGAPVINPPGGPSASSTPCWDTRTPVYIPTPSAVTPYIDLSALLLPNNGVPINVTTYTGHTTPAYPIPPGITQIVQTMLNSFGACTSWSLGFYTATGTFISGNQFGQNCPGSTIDQTHTFATVPTNAAYWAASAANGFPSQSAPSGFVAGVSFFCAGESPSTPVVPCCPPDPQLQAQLSYIRQLLELVYSTLPTPLSSLSEGTVHSGLTGGGTITLAGTTIAVRVDITAGLGNLGAAVGTPPYLFDAGYVVPIAAEGPIRGQTRVTYDPQLYMLPALTEQVGYSFHPGITVTITELSRGP